MKPNADTNSRTEPLVEPAPDEAVLRALAQSAYPVEFVESNRAKDEGTEAEQT
jgi:hypothetical protein